MWSRCTLGSLSSVMQNRVLRTACLPGNHSTSCVAVGCCGFITICFLVVNKDGNSSVEPWPLAFFMSAAIAAAQLRDSPRSVFGQGKDHVLGSFSFPIKMSSRSAGSIFRQPLNALSSYRGVKHPSMESNPQKMLSGDYGLDKSCPTIPCQINLWQGNYEFSPLGLLQLIGRQGESAPRDNAIARSTLSSLYYRPLFTTPHGRIYRQFLCCSIKYGRIMTWTIGLWGCRMQISGSHISSCG